MGLRESLRTMFDPLGPKAFSSPIELQITDLLGRAPLGTRAYRLPSVSEALGVPAIQRAVSLIASTTGTLTVQGYRNGELMDETPRLLTRPDPYLTPQAFYSMTSAQMATYGEVVWWIASRDNDGLASALTVVPLDELRVERNNANRLLPKYTWGDKVSTRYSTANPRGDFVHVMYPPPEPLALRGRGPLQICAPAVSVTVEAQTWAANFYSGGGYPSVTVKKAGILSPTRDENGLTEADRFRAAWTDRPNNVPRVIDDLIDRVDYQQPNPNGAQMLEARNHQNGEAARIFGIAGSLLEYQQPGSSLTYQNLEGEFTKFVKTCLAPLYLEPIEQAMSDLLTRSTVARFNVEGFLRADIKTRFDVHKIAIETGVYGPDYAQRVEGIIAGDVEFSPVPATPPAAIPVSLPRAMSTEVRCSNGHLLAELATAPYRFTCRNRECRETVTSDVARVA